MRVHPPLLFNYIECRMLDLNFVRDNLALVEEKLSQRGMNPAEVLKDFRSIDAERRQAITQTETLQARRNKASEEIARLKKNHDSLIRRVMEAVAFRAMRQKHNACFAAKSTAILDGILASGSAAANSNNPFLDKAKDAC